MSGKTIHNLLFSPFHFRAYLFWPAGETDLFQGFSLPVWVWFSQTNLGSNSCLTGSGVWTVLMSQGHGDPVACPQWVEACQMKGLGRRPGEGRWSAILRYPVSPLHFPCQLFNMRGWEVSWGIDSDCLPFFSLPCLYIWCAHRLVCRAGDCEGNHVLEILPWLWFQKDCRILFLIFICSFLGMVWLIN